MTNCTEDRSEGLPHHSTDVTSAHIVWQSKSCGHAQLQKALASMSSKLHREIDTYTEYRQCIYRIYMYLFLNVFLYLYFYVSSGRNGNACVCKMKNGND